MKCPYCQKLFGLKLTKDQVKEIIELGKKGTSIRQISKKTGFAATTITSYLKKAQNLEKIKASL